MPNAKARIGAAMLLALGAPAIAQQSTPRQDYEEITGRPKPAPRIPREFRAMVAEATPDRLVVRGLDGQPIPVSLDWIEPLAFTQWQDGRFLGFAFTGYEAEGYILVDRRMRGEAALLETGREPVFSPDGRFFAAAEVTDSAFGNLNGLGLWEVLPERTVRRLFTDVMTRAFDWRVDGWTRPGCAALSAIESGWQPQEGEDWEQAVRRAPRINFALEAGEAISLSPTYDRRPCIGEEAP